MDKPDLTSFNFLFSDEIVSTRLNEISSRSASLLTPAILKDIFSFIDMTSLNTGDNDLVIRSMCEKVNQFGNNYPGYKNVAAICVYPSMVEYVKTFLKQADVSIASVAGGFPSSQTFPEIKTKEAELAVQRGANEIDIVISAGEFLKGNYDFVFKEIKAIRETIPNAHLKVILETGLLKSFKNIYEASIISMQAGANFIKTSTGKMDPAATPEALMVMCLAVADYYKATGKKTGIKPAGGISNSEQAIIYYAIVREILGNSWLMPALFRIGASRLANNLLNDIHRLSTGEESGKKYF
ncbi:MAG TPA: deoxyribose-phosphate aldolase [Bacteroidales bacterium]|nr:deoxyribose-phosphate aldolase [Bacteroidales bacterium]